jgi:arabinofuranan 3-O-arabinosyltransferase
MRQYLRYAMCAVKYARWITRERLMLWGTFSALLAFFVLAYSAVVFPPSGVSRGGDFINYWSGALLAVSGRPEVAYNLGLYQSFQQSLVEAGFGWRIYSYPPVMMLLCWPLAFLSLGRALLAWNLFGIGLCAWSLSRLVGWRIAVLATIGAPAAFFNLVDGQNGYFSAVLLVWGLTLADRRPVLAGLLLGLLCSKPQLGALLPVALVAGRQWRALAAAAAWVIFLVAASTILLGPGAWLGFFDQMVLERRLLQFDSSTWAGMPTVFVLTRMAGADLTAAYLMQGVSAISAAAAVAALWHGRCPFGVKSAGLVVGTFLVTPHAYYYDMIVLIFAAAWLANEAVKTGFLPWEKLAILILLILPALSLVPALAGFQIGPILLWLTMAVILRRGLARPSPSFPQTSSFVLHHDSRSAI